MTSLLSTRFPQTTTTQLIEFVDKWTATVDARDCLDVLYFDFRRAFDSISIKRLCLKLSASRIAGSAHRWLTSFLTDRTFSVKIGKDLSESFPCLSRVPA